MSLTLFLLVLEVGLRIYNPIHVPLRANDIVLPVNNRFQYKNDSNLDKVDAVVVNTYNSLGFRGAEPPQDFAGATTLLTIGGSTTACHGLTDGKTWPDLVAAKLSDVPMLWLNNAGLDGHSTFGHLVLLKQVVAGLKPDYVLYLTGVNDVGRADLNDWDKGLAADDASLASSIIKHSELLSTLQVISRTFRAVDLGVFQRKDLDVLKHPRVSIDDAAIDATLAEHRTKYLPGYRARMLQLITETRNAGIEPILLTQPALYGDTIDPATQVALGELEFAGTSNARQQWRVLELYNDVLRALGVEHKVHVVELAWQMPKDSRYYTDWIHYSRAGAERVAAIVAEGLRPVLQQGSAHEHTRNIGLLSR